jgi:glycosyltransferase involved in cell wall biosynthesis
MNLLFIDPVCPRSYTCNTLRTEALGGSEASMLRICRALAAEGNDVSLYQHVDDQRSAATIEGIRHVGLNSEFPAPDVVIHFRSSHEMPVWESLYPSARHIMWTQDIVTPDVALSLRGREIICLTQWHQQQISEACAYFKILPKAIHQIYNPVEIDGNRYDKVPGRLGFFSSPHKGLDQVVSAFKQVGRLGRELFIANPGYVPDSQHHGANITNLGQLPHYKVMEELSRCEVLFYPQTVFPETMGIVLAEANAMGVPVLAHDFGAAKEVVRYGAVVDCTKPDNVKDALEALLCLQHKAELDPRFKLENVMAKWKELLGANVD